VSKHASLDLGPRAAFLEAQIKTDGVGESDTVEGNLAAKEANDVCRCLDELERAMNAEGTAVRGR
jgi:hypothetical protein